MGRDSGGCAFDIKGLVAPVTLNGDPPPWYLCASTASKVSQRRAHAVQSEWRTCQLLGAE